jgi:hypothetical protein
MRMMAVKSISKRSRPKRRWTTSTQPNSIGEIGNVGAPSGGKELVFGEGKKVCESGV